MTESPRATADMMWESLLLSTMSTSSMSTPTVAIVSSLAAAADGLIGGPGRPRRALPRLAEVD